MCLSASIYLSIHIPSLLLLQGIRVLADDVVDGLDSDSGLLYAKTADLGEGEVETADRGGNKGEGEKASADLMEVEL